MFIGLYSDVFKSQFRDFKWKLWIFTGLCALLISEAFKLRWTIVCICYSTNCSNKLWKLCGQASSSFHNISFKLKKIASNKTLNFNYKIFRFWDDSSDKILFSSIQYVQLCFLFLTNCFGHKQLNNPNSSDIYCLSFSFLRCFNQNSPK